MSSFKVVGGALSPPPTAGRRKQKSPVWTGLRLDKGTMNRRHHRCTINGIQARCTFISLLCTMIVQARCTMTKFDLFFGSPTSCTYHFIIIFTNYYGLLKFCSLNLVFYTYCFYRFCLLCVRKDHRSNQKTVPIGFISLCTSAGRLSPYKGHLSSPFLIVSQAGIIVFSLIYITSATSSIIITLSGTVAHFMG